MDLRQTIKSLSKYEREKKVILKEMEEGKLGTRFWPTDTYREDKDVIKKAIEKGYIENKFIAPSLFKDEDFALFIRDRIRNGKMDIKDLRINHQTNPLLCIEMVLKKGEFLEYLPNEHQHKNIVMEAVKNNGLALAYVKPELKHDREIILAALNQDGRAYKFLSPEEKSYKKLCLLAVNKNCNVIQMMDKKDITPVIALAALKQNLENFHFIPKEVFYTEKPLKYIMYASPRYACSIIKRENISDELFLKLAKKQSNYFPYLKPEQINKDMAKKAAKEIGANCIYNLPKELREDREIALIIFSKNNHVSALKYMDKLQNDKEICIKAIKNDPNNYRFSSFILKHDKDVYQEIINYHDYSHLTPEKREQKIKELYEYREKEIKNDHVLDAYYNFNGTVCQGSINGANYQHQKHNHFDPIEIDKTILQTSLYH